MRKIKYLVVHCSATKEGQYFDAAKIRDWHVNGNGWIDIGYHYVIKLDGTIEKGRPVSQIGAHVKGFNSYSIGICYVGGLNQDGKPKDTRTPEQKRAMSNLLVALKNIFTGAEILGHRDFKDVAKACPSFDVKQWLSETNLK